MSIQARDGRGGPCYTVAFLEACRSFDFSGKHGRWSLTQAADSNSEIPLTDMINVAFEWTEKAKLFLYFPLHHSELFRMYGSGKHH